MLPQRLSSLRILAIPLLLNLFVRQLTATPLQSEDEIIIGLQNSTIQARGGCENPCGYGGWLCCGASQSCYTDTANQAQCANGASITPAPTASWAAGHWQYWTSTWVQTDLITVTSVYSSWCPVSTPAPVVAVTTGAPVTCDWSSGESSCGNICCTSEQYCAVEGQCAESGSWTSSYSPALRPTSAGVVVATITTTTQPFIAAIPTAQAAQETSSSASLSVMGSSSSGLSGGAIAGIVIGVILGIFILLVICLFLCFRGAWHALLAIFGLGPRSRRRREVVEEYHRHGSRSGGRTWYGNNQPSRVEKKSSGLGWGGVLAGLGGLAVALGLKRRADRRKDEKSEYTASSYDYSSSYDSASSSDRRTRDTRRSRR